MVPSRLFAVFTVALLLTAGRLSAGVDRWTPMGPAGGVVTCLAAAPGIAGLVYAGTAAGVFKSRDGGTTWQPAAAGLPVGDPILFLAAGGRDGRMLYAATESALFVSTDGGGRWTQRPLPSEVPGVSNGTIAGLAASPFSPQTVFLSFRAGSFTGGLLRSTNGGKTWKLVDIGLGDSYNPASVLAMAISPSAPNTIYAAGYVLSLQIVRSTDGGAHWSPAGPLATDYSYDIRLAVDPHDPRTVYAAWSDKVAKSTDGGDSWSLLADIGTPPGQVIQGVAALAVDPVASRTLYLAFNRYVPGYGGWYDGGLLRFAGQIVRTTDGGATWSKPVDTDVLSSLAVDGVRTSRVYAGVARIGILRSNDRGGVWSKANLGLTTAPVCSVTPDLFTRGTLYISAGECGTPDEFLASNNDLGFLKGTGLEMRGWANLNQGVRDPARVLEAYGIVADPRTPGTLYAATGQGLFKSVNSGGRWTLQTGLASLFDAVYRVAVDPSDPRTLYVLGYKLGFPICGAFCPLLPVYDAAKSTDGGLTWTKLLPENLSLGFDAEDYTGFELVIDPTNPRTLYLGHASSDLFKSTDRGATWSTVSVRIPNVNGEGRVSRLVIDPTASRTLYAIAHFYPYSLDEAVVKSTDGGLSWARLKLALPARTEIRDLALDPARPDILYAATGRGVFVTNDGGAHWASLMTGLTKRNIWTIRIDPFDPATVYAGTEGDGGLFVLTRSDR